MVASGEEAILKTSDAGSDADDTKPAPRQERPRAPPGNDDEDADGAVDAKPADEDEDDVANGGNDLDAAGDEDEANDDEDEDDEEDEEDEDEDVQVGSLKRTWKKQSNT